MSDVDRRIEEAVRAFVAQLQSLISEAALLTVEQALGLGSRSGAHPARSDATRAARRPRPTTPRAAANKTAPKRRRKPSANGERRSEKQLLETAALIDAFIRDRPGARMEEISAALHVPRATLLRPLSKLLTSGSVRRKGVKRATRYYAARATTPPEAGTPSAIDDDVHGRLVRWRARKTVVHESAP